MFKRKEMKNKQQPQPQLPEPKSKNKNENKKKKKKAYDLWDTGIIIYLLVEVKMEASRWVKSDWGGGKESWLMMILMENGSETKRGGQTFCTASL